MFTIMKFYQTMAILTAAYLISNYYVALVEITIMMRLYIHGALHFLMVFQGIMLFLIIVFVYAILTDVLDYFSMIHPHLACILAVLLMTKDIGISLILVSTVKATMVSDTGMADSLDSFFSSQKSSH